MIYNKIYCGNAFDVLKRFPFKSVSMIVTSPPYWNQRNYGSKNVLWREYGGCEHEFISYKMIGNKGGHNSPKQSIKGVNNFQETEDSEASICTKCGVLSSQLGQEPTPELYITDLCDIFDTAEPVLADWGSLWVNIGDKRAGSGGAGNQYERLKKTGMLEYGAIKTKNIRNTSLVGIPFMFAIEMIKRGWCLKNTIIWEKPDAMPSSINNRFTDNFEYIFYFVKDEKLAYFRQQVEPCSYQQELKAIRRFGGEKYADVVENTTYSGREYNQTIKEGQYVRNKRSVWRFCTSKLKEKHFAPFPEELVQQTLDPCCPDRVCRICGEPVRYQRKHDTIYTRDPQDTKYDEENAEVGCSPDHAVSVDYGEEEIFCGCETPIYEPGIILDPFFGSGTTGLVALQNNRRFIGIDIKQEYIDLADKRLRTVFPYYDELEDDIKEI
jgi:DNA modification methylase